MKKELFAAGLLIIILALSLINDHYLENLTEELSSLTVRAGEQAADGDWEAALDSAQRALDLWKRQEYYTEIVLKHSDAESTEEALFRFLESIRVESPGASAACAQLLLEHLRTLCEMEKIRLGSVF